MLLGRSGSTELAEVLALPLILGVNIVPLGKEKNPYQILKRILFTGTPSEKATAVC